jgi:predicted DNA-binding protein
MLKSHETTLLGARIPSDLKQKLLQYCLGRGMKMSYFVSEAIKERLQEAAEEEGLAVIARKRLKDAKFISQKELNRYLSKRGINSA